MHTKNVNILGSILLLRWLIGFLSYSVVGDYYWSPKIVRMLHFMQGTAFVSYLVTDNQSKVYISIDISFILFLPKKSATALKMNVPNIMPTTARVKRSGI